jgi:hypothetical protein
MKTKDLIKKVYCFNNSTVGVMVDRFGDIQVISCTENKENGSIFYKSFSKDFTVTNYMSLTPDRKNEKRIFLDIISTSDGVFGRNIGSNVNEFAQFILKNKPFDYIYGIFAPGQVDSTNYIHLSQKDFDSIARKFYNKNGYEIISIGDYLRTPEKYPFLTEKDFEDHDFLIKIVAKNIDKQEAKSNFETINGVLVKNNVPEQVKEDIDSLQM